MVGKSFFIACPRFLTLFPGKKDEFAVLVKPNSLDDPFMLARSNYLVATSGCGPYYENWCLLVDVSLSRPGVTSRP